MTKNPDWPSDDQPPYQPPDDGFWLWLIIGLIPFAAWWVVTYIFFDYLTQKLGQ